MRKTTLLLLAFLFAFCATAQDKALKAALSEYFPVLPFDKGLMEVLTYFQKDANYVTDSVVGKSDTTELYVRGEHKTFNPFSFKPEKVLFCVRESENTVAYHITALLDGSPASKEIAAKEVEIINKKIRKYTDTSTPGKSSGKEPIPYMNYHYTVRNENTWMLGLGWSFVNTPYYTGYFVVFQIDLVKKYIK